MYFKHVNKQLSVEEEVAWDFDFRVMNIECRIIPFAIWSATEKSSSNTNTLLTL